MAHSMEERKPSSSNREIKKDLKDLVRNLANGLTNSEITKLYQSSLYKICSADLSLTDLDADNDEFVIVEQINKQIANIGNDNKEFERLHRTLVRHSQHVLVNRAAVLNFLLQLSDTSRTETTNNLSTNSSISNPFTSSNVFNVSPRTNVIFPKGEDSIEKLFPSPGKNISIASSVEDIKPNVNWLSGPMMKDESYENHRSRTNSINTLNRSDRTSNLRPNPSIQSRFTSIYTSSDRPQSVSTLASNMDPNRLRSHNTFEVPEVMIVQELLLCFRGIEGNHIKMDANQGFKLDPMSRVPQPHLVRHLMELGYLHNQIKILCKDLENRGTAAQGLTSAINSELTEYYKSIANYETKLQLHKFMHEDSPMSEENQYNSPPLTLRRLLVWAGDAMWQLQILCDICRNCLNKRGGAVISAAYLFLHHGDPSVQNTVTKILSGATRPLFKLICCWIIHGNLYDPMDEFFVAVNTVCAENNRWRDKFMLRESLIPAVMSSKQAEMVLNAGKCIHFLNEICGKKIELRGARTRLQYLEDSEDGDLLALADPTSELSMIIESAFKDTSKLVLEVLKAEFKLYENFQALRRYMLMGQGDFYRYFMQLLEPELRKSATLLYQHNLMATMESAMRATNAQFEDENISKRLSVKLLEPSDGETGWDVFNMDYNVDGPLDTVFRLSEGTYQQMFHFLWRLKRVEYVLSFTWKEQTSFLKKLLRMNTEFQELRSVLTQSSLLTSEMVHYIHQVQYYILFEVMECAFENFAQKFKTATSIEEVINEHEKFLQEIKAKTFLDDDDKSKKFAMQLRITNDLILELQYVTEKFLGHAEFEFNRRVEREILVEREGTDAKSEAAHKTKKDEFRSILASVKAQLRILSQSYQEVLKNWLIDLSLENQDLQLLATRIDFNEFYKRSDPKLSESMKLSFYNYSTSE